MLKMRGFTLFELVIVIIILGILSIYVFVKWPGYTINLNAQAQQVANDIRYTQSLAFNKNLRFYLIRTSATSYEIRTLAGGTVLLALGTTSFNLNSGISFGTFTNLPNNLIAFNGSGVPYVDTTTPGTPLISTATIPLTAGGETKTISISPETGRVLVQ